MDIPLENIDFGILSHAHYDHANGMEYFFKRNRHAKFYLQKSCAENCYAYEEGRFRYIGIPKDLLTAYQDRLIYADGDAALCDGVYAVAHKRKNREKIGEREQMYQKKNGGFHLFNKTDEEILRLAEQIRETGIESVYTGHCTGDRAFALLKGKLGSMAEQLKVGLSIEF